MLKLTSIHLMGLSTGPQLSRTKALNSHWNDYSLCLKLTFLDLKLSPIFFPLILIFIILSIPFFSPNNSLLFPNPTFFLSTSDSTTKSSLHLWPFHKLFCCLPSCPNLCSSSETPLPSILVFSYCPAAGLRVGISFLSTCCHFYVTAANHFITMPVPSKGFPFLHASPLKPHFSVDLVSSPFLRISGNSFTNFLSSQIPVVKRDVNVHEVKPPLKSLL